MSKKSFESNMDRLTEIANLLEEGGSSLESSIKLYKEAVKTVKLLKKELDDAKGAVVIMQRELDGAFTENEVFEDEL